MRAHPLLLALALVGCGTGADADAGTDTGTTDASVDPIVPWLSEGVPPIEPPMLTPCPDGWREIRDEDGLAVCDPYPEAGPAECPAGQAHFPGEPGCASVGAPCPAGEFADGLADDGSVAFVRAGATGGDGTRGAPFGTVAEALSARGPDATIALAKGTHTGSISLWLPSTLIGACAAETHVAAGSEMSIVVTAPGVVVRGLTIDGEIGLAVNGDGATADIEGLVIDGGGLFAGSGAILRGRSLDVSGTDLTPAVLAPECMEVELERTVLAGIVWARACVARLSRTRVRGLPGRTLMDPAITQFAASEVFLSEVIVDSTPGFFLLSNDGAASLEANDLVVRDAGATLVGTGATVSLERATFERTGPLYASGPGSRLSLTDTRIRDVVTTIEVPNARGINVEQGATAELRRVVIERASEMALLVLDTGTRVDAWDLVVSETRPRPDGQFGRAIEAQGGASVEVTRALFERNHDVSLHATQAGTRLTATDVVVRDTLERGCADTTCAAEPAGFGAAGVLSGSLRLTRFIVQRSALCGVVVARDGTVELDTGLVTENPVGACVQVPGYDVDRLTNGVLFVDNGRSLESTSYAAPEPASPMRL